MVTPNMNARGTFNTIEEAYGCDMDIKDFPEKKKPRKAVPQVEHL